MGQLRRCMMEVPLVLSSGQMPNCGVGTWGGGGGGGGGGGSHIMLRSSLPHGAGTKGCWETSCA